MPADGKNKALETTLASITKKFGDGAIMRLGEAHHMAVEAIPTGALSLDIALGVGGIPRGRITEIYGPESSGKTTICQHIVAEAQKMGGTCAYVDMEHALDPSYAARCGVNVDNLLISQPDTGEQALEITETLVRSGAVDVVVIDRNNYHTFLALLYQVAAAELTAEDIAYPVRSVFSKIPNIDFVLAYARQLDLQNRQIETDGETIFYDYLILANGSVT